MKLQMGMLFLSIMILVACSQGTSNAYNTPEPQENTQDNETTVKNNLTASTEVSKVATEAAVLSDGSKLLIFDSPNIAILQAKEIHYKLKMGLVSTNWGFLPYPQDIKKSCEEFRDNVELTLKKGLPISSSDYSRVLSFEAVNFTLERNLNPQLNIV